jgi:hypothetical protein
MHDLIKKPASYSLKVARRVFMSDRQPLACRLSPADQVPGDALLGSLDDHPNPPSDLVSKQLNPFECSFGESKPPSARDPEFHKRRFFRLLVLRAERDPTLLFAKRVLFRLHPKIRE